MSATFEQHDGCTTCISDEGYRRLAAEQHDLASDRQRAEILMWTVCAGVIAIAVLMIKHLWSQA